MGCVTVRAGFNDGVASYRIEEMAGTSVSPTYLTLLKPKWQTV